MMETFLQDWPLMRSEIRCFWEMETVSWGDNRIEGMICLNLLIFK